MKTGRIKFTGVTAAMCMLLAFTAEARAQIKFVDADFTLTKSWNDQFSLAPGTPLNWKALELDQGRVIGFLTVKSLKRPFHFRFGIGEAPPGGGIGHHAAFDVPGPGIQRTKITAPITIQSLKNPTWHGAIGGHGMDFTQVRSLFIIIWGENNQEFINLPSSYFPIEVHLTAYALKPGETFVPPDQNTPGDADEDGQVSMSDLNLLVDWILGRNAMPGNSTAAHTNSDVNGDGSIGMTDLNLLVDYILGRITSFPVA